MKILVIIPCYNEQQNIVNVIDNIKNKAPEVDYLIVNDASTDNSEEILKKMHYNYISLPVNLGIGGGVQAGYKYAKANNYDIAVQLDGDGQHNPEFLPDIINPVASGEYDMCIGSRFIKNEGFQTSFLRRLGITTLSIIIKILCNVRIKDVTSGFRACNKGLIDYFCEDYAQDYPEPEAIISAVLNGFKIGEVAVLMNEREFGTSSISPIKSLYYMLKVGLSLFIFRITKKRRKEKNK